METSGTAQAIEDEADRATSRGDIVLAQQLLERVVAAMPTGIDTWLKLAAIRRANGDLPAAIAAVSAALAIDPLHLMALLSRARLLEASGDGDEAARCYLRALAQRHPEDPSPLGISPLIAHAEAVGDAYRNRISGRYLAAAERDGPLDKTLRGRIERFTSNALRTTRVYHCEPTHYHYPGLVEREFHDRVDFPALSVLEEASSAITEEFMGLWSGGLAQPEPYIQYSTDAPVRQWSALNHSLDWTAFHLLRGGKRIGANADRCPKTMAILAAIEQPQIGARSPNAMFSLLKPRTVIPPHTGITNTRLVCHLPLIVPESCWFRVGATKRQWIPGKAFVFDDTIEHEAANPSDDPRIVLIIDLWHPGLSIIERTAIARIMETDTAIGGTPL